MPWRTDVSKERVKLVLEWERRRNDGEGDLDFAALCREFGVSRMRETSTGCRLEPSRGRSAHDQQPA